MSSKKDKCIFFSSKYLGRIKKNKVSVLNKNSTSDWTLSRHSSSLIINNLPVWFVYCKSHFVKAFLPNG